MNNHEMLQDYHVDVWLTDQRINSAKLSLLNSYDILLISGLLDKYLAAWSEIEILKELRFCKNIKDQLYSDDVNLDNVYDNLAEFSKHRISIIRAWSSYHWSNRLESLYLSKKNSLEKISFDLINTDSNEIAFEVYHRLKAEELTFEKLYWQFNKSDSKSQENGIYKSQPIKSFPKSMHSYLRRLDPGDILSPFVNGKYFSVLRMNSLHSPSFDKVTKDLLLYEEFLDWQQDLLLQLKSILFS